MVDVKRLLRAQHDVQKNAAETDVLRLSEREGKQIDYILTRRRYLRNVKDAEANDMIHMGSDHRCVMATFLINMPEKKINVRRGNTKHETTVYVEHEEKAKNNNIEMSELEKRYQVIIVTIKKAAAKKENEAHDTRNGAKNTAAAAEAESTLVVNVAQETEGRSKKRSSKDDNQRDTAAASEAGSTIVDTVAHETEGGSKKRSSKDDEQRGTAAALEAESTLVDTVVHETEGSTTMRSSEADIYGVVLLISSTDVRTGGRLHLVEKTMKRIAVSMTRQAHNHS